MLTFWFSSIVPWSVGLVNNFRREVWLCCYGVPVHAWNMKTFDAIARNWGEVIQFEEDTINGVHVDVGKVKIFTRHVGLINQSLILEVGSLSFSIRVEEEQSVHICNSCADCRCCNYGDSVIPVDDQPHPQVEYGVVESSNVGNNDWAQRNRIISPIEAASSETSARRRRVAVLINEAQGSKSMEGGVSRIGNSFLVTRSSVEAYQERGRGENGVVHGIGQACDFGDVGSDGLLDPRAGRLLICLGSNSGHPAESPCGKAATGLIGPSSTVLSPDYTAALRTTSFLRRNRKMSKQKRLKMKSKLPEVINRGFCQFFFSRRTTKETVASDQGRSLSTGKATNLVAESLAPSILHQQSLTLVEAEK
ncbi:hypothetical protein Dimus_002835, partial [Dionaea muscipula]